MPKKYCVFDVCEYVELLGKFETMQEVRHAAHQRDADTDGDCFIVVLKFDKPSGFYQPLQGWTY